MKIITTALVLLAVSIPSPTPAAVDKYSLSRNVYGVLLNTPIYDKHSKSYLAIYLTRPPGDYEDAIKHSRSLIFKGVRGGLAIIRSPQTQALVNRVFRPHNETWIGLRMNCKPRVMFWSNGKRLNHKKDYMNWGRHWRYKTRYLPCPVGAGTFATKYAGVSLTMNRTAGYTEQRLSWHLIAPTHGVYYSLIQFPTGKP